MSWWSDLQLTYKYFLIFGCLITAVLLAGGARALIDRRKMEKLIKKIEAEKQAGESGDLTFLTRAPGAAPAEEDLFGVAAIDAGFYAGIPQSRPASAANSGFNTPMRVPSVSYMSPNGRFLGDVDKQLMAGDVSLASVSSLGGTTSLSGSPALHGLGSPLARSELIGSGSVVGSPTVYRPSDLSQMNQSGHFSPSSSSSAVFHNPDQPLAPALYDPRRPPSGDELGVLGRAGPAVPSGPSTPGQQFTSLPNYQASPPRTSPGRHLT